jgi:hypothetical protein
MSSAAAAADASGDSSRTSSVEASSGNLYSSGAIRFEDSILPLRTAQLAAVQAQRVHTTHTPEYQKSTRALNVRALTLACLCVRADAGSLDRTHAQRECARGALALSAQCSRLRVRRASDRTWYSWDSGFMRLLGHANPIALPVQAHRRRLDPWPI